MQNIVIHAITAYMSVLNPDIPSPEITSPQIKDFANRVLLRGAEQLGGGHEWMEVASHMHIETEEWTKELMFEASWSEASGSILYIVKIEHIQPFDEKWNPEVAKGHVGMGFMEPLEDFGGNIGYIDEPIPDIDIPVNDLGYCSTETSYVFNVPYGKRTALAHKSTRFNFYDEYRDPVDTEIVHYWSAFSNLSTPRDIEHLVKFGEKMLDTDNAEASLSNITVYDLQLVLNGLKRFGIADPRQVVLSAKVRNTI